MTVGGCFGFPPMLFGGIPSKIQAVKGLSWTRISRNKPPRSSRSPTNQRAGKPTTSPPINIKNRINRTNKKETKLKTQKTSISPKWTGNFILMVELRTKILTFRDIIDLPPLDGSPSITELVMLTMKDLQKLCPEKRFPETKREDMDKMLIHFYDALKSIGDSSIADPDWIDKSKYKNSSVGKNQSDKLVEKVLAALDGLIKATKERFDSMELEDEDLKKDVNSSKANKTMSSRTLSPSESFSESSSSFCSSPITPRSVLPELIIGSPGKSASQVLWNLRVQALEKLSPLDVKKLAMHILSQKGAQDVVGLSEKSGGDEVATEKNGKDGESIELEGSRTATEEKDHTEADDQRKSSAESKKNADEKPKTFLPEPSMAVEEKISTQQVLSVPPSPSSQMAQPMEILPPSPSALLRPNLASSPPPPPSTTSQQNVAPPPPPPPSPPQIPQPNIARSAPPPPPLPPVSRPTTSLMPLRPQPGVVSKAPAQPPPMMPPRGSTPPPPPQTPPRTMTVPPPPPPPQGSAAAGPPPAPPLVPCANGAAGPPPPPMPLANGAGPPPPPAGAGRCLCPKKASTKLKRSSHIGNLYRILKGKLEGCVPEAKSSGRKKGSTGSASVGGKPGMADALVEMTKRSAYFQQIEEDVQKYAKSINELKSEISKFQTKDMTELLKFHQKVESVLENLTDETQVLARFEGFPQKKLEALRIATALYLRLHNMETELRNWKIEPPLNQLLYKVERYSAKIKGEVDALERTKDEEAKKLRSHNILFDFNILVQIKESMVDVSSSCMELALKEKIEAKTAQMGAEAKTNTKQNPVCNKMLWRAFQLVFKVYTFAGGHDDRADQLTRELAHEIQATLRAHDHLH